MPQTVAKCQFPIVQNAFVADYTYFVVSEACAGLGNGCERLRVEIFVRVLRSSRVNLNNVNNMNVFCCV